MAGWLTLQEYSNKLGLSISTLRRKIKGGEIEHTFKNGKYLIKAPVEDHSDSVKELKEYYQNLLSEKETDIKRLENDREDLIHLVDYLERQKAELLDNLKSSDSPSS